MEIFIQWISVFLSLITICIFIKNRFPKEWLMIFFATGYVSHFLTVLFVKEFELFEYPIRLVSAFKGNIVFDYLVLPCIAVSYYKVSYDSSYLKALIQLFLYVVPLVLFEYWAETNTQLIQFYTWNIWYTVASEFLFLLGIRSLGLFYRNKL